MISVLIVGRDAETLGELEGIDPSVEVLLAYGLEDALEKLGRNRRIDAVLLLGGSGAEEIVRAIREDSPAHPPIYLPASDGAVTDTVPLPASEARILLDMLRKKLQD